MLLQVHRLSHRVLTKMHGSPEIHVDRSSPLLPILSADPRRGSSTRMTDQIRLHAHREIMTTIHPDAGHTLYRMHMQQMMDWITLHVEMGQMAWPAMMDFYRVHGIQDDDFDPASVYRMWHRGQHHKKTKKKAYIQPVFVLKNMQVNPKAFKGIFEAVSDLIERDPEAFYTRSGHPDASMIRKAMMYVMASGYRWKQSDIAALFQTDQSGVSRHIQSFLPYTRVLVS